MGERRVVPLRFGGELVYMEVADLGEAGSNEELENVDAGEDIGDAGDRVAGTVRALAGAVKEALGEAAPREWSLEVTIGFKGKAGIPFITEGEANGAVKVIAKWGG